MLRESVNSVKRITEPTPSHGKVVLKQVLVSRDVFDNILKSFPLRVKKVNNIKKFYRGYVEKSLIAYDGFEYLICTEAVMSREVKLVDFVGWKQMIVRVDDSLPVKTIERDISGGYAYNYMMRLLKRYYSEEEVDEILHSYDSINKELSLIQMHVYPKYEGLAVYKNCFAYDINSAHASALAEMFPRAAQAINRIYLKRKEKPIYKQVLNYTVGMFAHKGYRGAYNWIVQKTTRTLQTAILKTRGKLIYANTDGFIVESPLSQIDVSKKLGDFKLEYQGEVRTYLGDNYYLVQMGDKKKGSIPCALRDKVDLREGRVVKYRRALNKEIGLYEYTDIEEVIL